MHKCSKDEYAKASRSPVRPPSTHQAVRQAVPGSAASQVGPRVRGFIDARTHARPLRPPCSGEQVRSRSKVGWPTHFTVSVQLSLSPPAPEVPPSEEGKCKAKEGVQGGVQGATSSSPRALQRPKGTVQGVCVWSFLFPPTSPTSCACAL